MPAYENVCWPEIHHMHMHTCTHTHIEQLFPSVKGCIEFRHYFKILKFLCVYSTLSCITCNYVLWNSGWKTAIIIETHQGYSATMTLHWTCLLFTKSKAFYTLPTHILKHPSFHTQNSVWENKQTNKKQTYFTPTIQSQISD
jgi:hypothetical protein